MMDDPEVKESVRMLLDRGYEVLNQHGDRIFRVEGSQYMMQALDRGCVDGDFEYVYGIWGR